MLGVTHVVTAGQGPPVVLVPGTNLWLAAVTGTLEAPHATVIGRSLVPGTGHLLPHERPTAVRDLLAGSRPGTAP